MSRVQCAGTGKQAEERPGSVYPYCPACGKELAAQGRKAQRRYSNAWQVVPRHFPTAKLRTYHSDRLGAVTIPEDEPDYGGVFDGFGVVSDADPGL